MDKIDRLLKNELYISCMERIKKAEKERIFCLHGIEHSLDVARICYITSLEQGLNIDKEIIYATALLHDIGRCVEYESNISHHAAGEPIARQILCECGFSDGDADIICDAIASHKSRSDDSKNALKKLLFTADKLSRNCFSCEASDKCYWPFEQKNKSITI